jgi:hypothetical protein
MVQPVRTLHRAPFLLFGMFPGNKFNALRRLGVIGGAVASVFMLSACADLLWESAQLPGLRELNDRMNQRALERRLSGDPLKELALNTAQGDYSYMGIEDRFTNQRSVPGIPRHSYTSYQVVWLETDKSQTWTASAARYFSTYNRALVSRRHGKKLDEYGTLIQ